MCGIIGIFDLKGYDEKLREKALKMASLIRHRGPDWSGIYCDDNAILAHERLSIVDVEHGAQPLFDKEKDRVLCVNGEIYNHKEIRKELKKKHPWQTKSDCEVILYLYDEFGPKVMNMISGIYVFALYDKKKKDYFIGRDHMGICPLYIGWDKEKRTYVASEMKSLDKYCDKIQEFPPGHYYLGSEKNFVKWYNPKWEKEIPKEKLSIKKLREELEKAVKKQLMCDVPYGVLISGGLDSSIIASIAAKYRKHRIESNDKEEAWWPRLHSFAVGLKDSPDLKYAKMVSKYIDTVHHEIIFSIQEGFDAIRDVIYHLETFDVTTIRAATPMYLMSRKIKSMGIKMVLSGEGADEVFGGYLYFHKAPNKEEFHEENVRKLFMLSKYDCLRANKSTAAWGVEARVPFLDKEFLEYAMGFDPKEKMCIDGRMEKYVLRKAFEGYIPKEILWRQKEQFSDGVGYGWIDYLKKHAEEYITDEELKKYNEKYKGKTIFTKEGIFYKNIFDELFKNKFAELTVPIGPSIACSTPTAFRWSKEFEKMNDPSGRAVKEVHEKAVDKV
jgi:asparagine synthase (glutamine-hydrolysing)